MRNVIALLTLVFALWLVAGCDYLTPTAEKSKTEKKQLTQLIEQNKLLERIAVAIENHGRYTGH